MERNPENDADPLNTSEEIRKKAREELNRQLQGLLNNQPIEKLTDENIEDEVNRLMEEVDIYEKNYVPKDLDENEINELNNFEEEFGQEDIEDIDEDEINENEIKENKEKNIINTNIFKLEKNKEDKFKKSKKETFKKKRSNIDMDLDLKDLEDIIKKDYTTKDKNNKKEGNITEDKEIKDLLDEYDKKLDKELEKEVEKEFKPKIDIKDVKRADLLLKIDPLINEALVQGKIKKDELVLFIDYYEIFSLSNKAKKFTSQQLQAIDELCYKKNNGGNNEEIIDEKNKKKEKYDLNDENAIDKLTNEIEKGLQDSEEILMKKLDYEKYKMELSKKKIKNKNIENNIDINNKNTLNKNNNSSNSTKTIKTNYTLNNDLSQNKIITNHEKNRPISGQSDISSFTQEELNSVPRYSLPGSKKEKIKDKKISNEKNKLNISSDKTNKTFYPNDINNKNKDNINIINQKPKTPYNILTNNINNKKANNSNNSSTTSISIPSGKKTIPPLKKSKNAINLKSKTDQNIDLFDDNANPISLGKYRGARKDMVKLKMGGKSKVHELFVNKPRNIEENEKIKQKFMEFIKEGKENKKYPDVNGTKKSIARKKIEDAQNYNKSNK
jgi:hypothetical protein